MKAVLFSRATAALLLLAGCAACAGWLFGVDVLVRPFAGYPVLPPGAAVQFVLIGACLWMCAQESPPRTLSRWLSGIVTAGGLVAMTGHLFGGITSQAFRWFPGTLPAPRLFYPEAPAFATALAFALTGVALWGIDRESGGKRHSVQWPVLPVFWMAYLGLLAGFYGVSPRNTFLIHLILPPHTSILFILGGLGILLARPRSNFMAVITSPSIGGLIARIFLPVIALLPFTVGWLRLQALRSGDYDLASGFAMFTTTNAVAFAFFTWIGARMLNRMDATRQRAFESLQVANRELRRVNAALEAKIAEQIRTEEARKRTELQLFQSQKMEAMGTLASGIAHDFNNLLTVILLNTETALESGPRDPALHGTLLEIKKSGSRAAEVVRQIMTFGRKSPSGRAPVQLREMAGEAVEMLRHAIPPGVTVRVNIADGLPHIQADATQVQQVLLNLGTNAAQAMAEGGGSLEIDAEAVVFAPDHARPHAELRPGGYLRVTVRDSGPGMDTETLERIFDPFFTTKPPGKGTGLGLSVVHGIMQLHEGCVTAHSEPGRGSVFSLYFPVNEGEKN